MCLYPYSSRRDIDIWTTILTSSWYHPVTGHEDGFILASSCLQWALIPEIIGPMVQLSQNMGIVPTSSWHHPAIWHEDGGHPGIILLRQA